MPRHFVCLFVLFVFVIGRGGGEGGGRRVIKKFLIDQRK